MHSDENTLYGNKTQIKLLWNSIKCHVFVYILGSKTQGGQEGGIREPSAIMWPGHLPAGFEVSVPTTQMDLFPTLLAAAGVPLPTDRVYDGKDITPLLKGKTKSPPHKFMFHHCGIWLHAVRYTPGDGKYLNKKALNIFLCDDCACLF